MSADLDYLDHLGRESERFADVLLTADPMRAVPSCPDWTTIDLFWHLTEVQWFWGTVVRERADDPSKLSSGPPQRPTDLDSLGHVYATVSAELEDVLANTPPDTPVWTWAHDKTAGFVRRRQAHEALIHRVDAELVAGKESEIDADLATDGIDEILRVMYGAVPVWGSFERDGNLMRIETTDTDTGWTLLPGRFTGADPDSGEQYDRSAFEVLDDAEGAGGPADAGRPAATVRGTAAELDRWLWGRLGADQVERTGDDKVLEHVQSVVDRGIG